jgi:hypothetical protein
MIQRCEMFDVSSHIGDSSSGLSLRSATHPRPMLRTTRGAVERDPRSLGLDHLHLRGPLLRTGSRSRAACAFLNVSLEEVVYGKE